MAALYIHIPFCAGRCAYCDFVSYAGRRRDMARYLSALASELNARAGELNGRTVHSVYIGGGTPTFVGAEALAMLMDIVRRHYKLSPDCEISCEANPDTVTAEGLALMRAAGINRLSMGVQAAQPSLLKTLGRIHSFERACEAFEAARAAGFDNINLDFMYALPGQTPDMWRESLARAVELNPEHLSLYSLILEEGTRIYRSVKAGKLSLPDEDAEMEMIAITGQALSSAGYRQYEISNYAHIGRKCKHNILYWQNGEYLGVGCAAHSRLGMARLYNAADLDDYMDRVEACGSGYIDRLALTEKDDAFDTIMLGTRMTAGIDIPAFVNRHGIQALDALRDEFEKLSSEGLAEFDAQHFCLTARGLMIQNTVLVEIMDIWERA